MRTTTKTVTFQRPFILDGFSELLPAGTYTIETEEEPLDSMIVAAWRRVSTTVRVRVDGAIECRAIDPDALHEALMRDSTQGVSGNYPPKSAAKVRFERAKQFTTYPARRKKV